MATAPAADQLQLLKVAQLDAAIARLEREDEKHPLREELAAIVNAAAAKDRDKKAAEGEVTAAAAALEEAEARAASLVEQIAAKDAQLASGEGMDSRMLLAMQDEINGLRAMLAEANDAEFAALSALEEAEGSVEKIAGEIAGLKEQMLARKAELEDAVAEISAEKNRLLEDRSALFMPLAPALKELYEQLRARGGYTVLAMKPNGSTDAGIQLSPVEVDAIRNAAEDEICVAEEYGCIVVRDF